MISFNNVILVGRLTKDPELKYTTNGTAVATFTLAVDRPTRKGTDDKDNTDFIRVVAYQKLAEFTSNYLSKGRLVLVEGELRINKWQTASGENRNSAEILSRIIRFMEPKGSSEVMSNSSENNEVADKYSEPVNENKTDENKVNENNDEPPF